MLAPLPSASQRLGPHSNLWPSNVSSPPIAQMSYGEDTCARLLVPQATFGYVKSNARTLSSQRQSLSAIDFSGVSSASFPNIILIIPKGCAKSFLCVDTSLLRQHLLLHSPNYPTNDRFKSIECCVKTKETSKNCEMSEKDVEANGVRPSNWSKTSHKQRQPKFCVFHNLRRRLSKQCLKMMVKRLGTLLLVSLGSLLLIGCVNSK